MQNKAHNVCVTHFHESDAEHVMEFHAKSLYIPDVFSTPRLPRVRPDATNNFKTKKACVFRSKVFCLIAEV